MELCITNWDLKTAGFRDDGRRESEAGKGGLSPELGLLVTWTKPRAEKAVWRKRGFCGFVPKSLFHMGPNSAGSVHWL